MILLLKSYVWDLPWPHSLHATRTDERSLGLSLQLLQSPLLFCLWCHRARRGQAVLMPFLNVTGCGGSTGRGNQKCGGGLMMQFDFQALISRLSAVRDEGESDTELRMWEGPSLPLIIGSYKYPAPWLFGNFGRILLLANLISLVGVTWHTAVWSWL